MDNAAVDPRFGKQARDKVTGFEGVITGKSIFMYGCEQLCLMPSVDKEGKMREGQWFDVARIELLEEKVKPAQVRAEKPGGPNPDLPRAR